MKSSSFASFIEGELEAIPDLKFRRMFGGFGLYAGDVFFGIIHGDRLYFRTGGQSQKRYEAEGMTVFVTPARKKPLRKYYEVPLHVIEQPTELIEWAREAVANGVAT